MTGFSYEFRRGKSSKGWARSSEVASLPRSPWECSPRRSASSSANDATERNGHRNCRGSPRFLLGTMSCQTAVTTSNPATRSVQDGIRTRSVGTIEEARSARGASAVRWERWLAAKRDEPRGSRRQRSGVRTARAERIDRPPGLVRNRRRADPVVVIPIAAIDAVEPLERRGRPTRIREPEPRRTDRVGPLERRIDQTRRVAELRALNGREKNRSHDQDREDRSDQSG